MELPADMFFGINPYIVIALLLWTIPWKAWALWLSARRGDFWWFIIMLVFSSLAIVEIIYIFFVAKQKDGIEEKEGTS